MIDDPNIDSINAKIEECRARNPGSFGEPYTAIKIENVERKRGAVLTGGISLYADFTIDYTGRIAPLPVGDGGAK